MITYGSTTLTSYNTITKIEVYYYKSTSATSLSGGSWSTTKPTWENGKYIWQKIRTTYEGKLENGQFYSESDPVNITGQQGATGTAAYSYKLNASDTTVTVSKIGVYSVNKITFTATSKQGTDNVVPYAGQFKIETTINGTTWTTSYTSSGNESSKEFTIPTGIIAIRCSLYQANGTTTLLDIMTIPILSDDRPITTKTYTGLIGSANDAANASFYFAKIHPDSYTTNYKVKMKVRVTAPEAYAETIDIQFGGYGSTFSSFDAYTTRTGSVGVYYINLYRATQAGISTNHKGHALGIGLRSSTNPTHTSYKRTIIVDILELDGCTIEMLDTAVKYANIDGTGSTNYYGLTEMSVGTAGQNATNNTNTHYTQYSNNVKAGTNGIKGYTLIMKDSENTWSCFYSGAYKGVNTEKPVYTGGFILGKILYSVGAGAQTSDSSLDTYYNYKSGVNTSTIYDAYPVDLRYSTNCAGTLTSQRPVYIVGTIENDGLFHLDVSQWYTQTEPTYADGKVYVYVGMAYSSYQVWLSTENPAYVFYDGEFILYDKALTLQNINSLKTSLETQIDSKVETWCQKTNPANSWSAEERPNHTGDLWYYIGESGTTYKNNTTYQYNGSTNTWSAYSANPDLFDKIDGKTAIYYGTQSSVTSAEEGDYLVDSENDCTYRWNNGAWVLATDYKQVAIDAVEIGGRNLIRDTADWSNCPYAGDTASINGEEFIAASTTATAWRRINGWFTKTKEDIYYSPIIISFDVKKSDETPLSEIVFQLFTTNKAYKTQTSGNLPEGTRYYTNLSFNIWRNTENVNKDTWTRVYSIPIIMDEYFNTGSAYTEYDYLAFYIGVKAATGSASFRHMKIERGNKATDWTPAPEDVENSIQEYAESIQSQVDGMAEIHYGTAVPTLSNAPYTSWTDTATRNMHVDDLYYNTSTGYCYRFTKSGSTYAWSRIKDSDITAAATVAGNAQTTANNANTLAGQKRRIFVSRPTPPYEVGDLWVEGSSGDIKKCKTARATGSYTASDWELASKYTDDTTANTANTKVDNLKKVRLGWKVNYSAYGTVNNGECYFHGYDANNAPADINGIVEWNGADLTITKGMWINPNQVAPYNTPILHVYRTDVEPHHADVWWDETLKKWRGYMYKEGKTPDTTSNLTSAAQEWTWNEVTDCILATYVSSGSEGAITSAQLFNPPKKFSELPDPSLAHELVDNLEVGGRNLLLNTAKMSTWNKGTGEVTLTDEYALLQGSDADWGSRIDSKKLDLSLLDGETNYILSFEYKTSVDAVDTWIEIAGTNYTLEDNMYGRTKYCSWLNPSITLPNTNGEWKKFTTIPRTIALSDLTSGSGDVNSWYVQMYIRTNNANLYVRKFKLEKGNKPTDWTPAPEDTQADIDTALAQSVEYIIGTQTATTGNWTGVSSSLTELKDGTQIRYWLPYAGSGNATLNLTLKDGTATGAIPVYRQGGSASSAGVVTANRVTTHFPAGTSISMVYGVNRVVSAVYSGTTYTGTFTGWFADGAYDSGNTINRTRLQNAITAETAITAAHIICGTATGYKNIGAGINFDLSYPILYASSAIAVTKTGDNNYLQINGIAASNNGTIQSGATKKVLYLKGTISGNIFTISASPFMTTVTPTNTDGFYYIPLGMMYSTTNIYFISSNRLYAYLDGAFQPVDTAAILRAEKAKKTATNYMSSDNTGIMVADLADGEQLPANATGKNVFITAGYGEGSSVVNAGVHIRNGQEDLAIFGETAIIGKEDNVHLQVGSTGIYGQNSNNSNDRFFEISQNNGVETIESRQKISEDFSRNNTVTKQFTIKLSENKIDDKIKYSVHVLDKRTLLSLYDITGEFFTSNLPQIISISPSSGSYSGTITISEKDENNNLLGTIVLQQEDVDLSLECSSYIYYSKLYTTPSFTFGSRIIDSEYGGYSTVNGLSNIASGNYSYAGGKETIAEGDNSFAMGIASEARENCSVAIGEHVIAKGNNQTVIGCYNKEDDESLFVIGNGADATLFQRRSNALTVDQTGNIFMYLSVSSTSSPSSNTTDGLLYTAIAALGWENDVVTT